MVDRPCCPDIFGKTNDLEGRIDIAPEDLSGPIARRIVDDDDLKGKPALQPANTVQAFLRIALAIKDINDDGDEGMAHALRTVGLPAHASGPQAANHEREWLGDSDDRALFRFRMTTR